MSLNKMGQGGCLHLDIIYKMIMPFSKSSVSFSLLATQLSSVSLSPVLSGHCYHDCKSGQKVKLYHTLLYTAIIPPTHTAIWISAAWSCCQLLY